ncbi:hypothetical protein AAF134_06805 [Synechococcus lacustris Tous-12m]
MWNPLAPAKDPWPIALALGQEARRRGVFTPSRPRPRPRLGWRSPAASIALEARPAGATRPGGPLVSDGAIAASQQRLANCVGAERSWYGVNGASGLLQAALLGAVPPGGGCCCRATTTAAFCMAAYWGIWSQFFMPLPLIKPVVWPSPYLPSG